MIEFIGRAAGTVLLAIALAAFSGHDSRAKTITDSAGRTVEVPDQIAHVLAAGPPAAVILYTLAPDKLIGWTRELNAQEAEFVAPTYRGLPVVGRITGKEGKLTPDVVVALHPDAIIDVGTINSEYVELADRFQKQTGIPYVLIDGMLASSAETYRTLGAILGAAPRAEELAHYADATLKDVADQVAAVPQGARPRVYYGRGADGLETGTTGSIN
ncbi:MAG TPA: hypothetical protein VKB34_00915, partial [Povalibacter sp.]|nr:hypothetical protein [Povalibacter sp.]